MDGKSAFFLKLHRSLHVPVGFRQVTAGVSLKLTSWHKSDRFRCWNMGAIKHKTSDMALFSAVDCKECKKLMLISGGSSESSVVNMGLDKLTVHFRAVLPELCWLTATAKPDFKSMNLVNNPITPSKKQYSSFFFLFALHSFLCNENLSIWYRFAKLLNDKHSKIIFFSRHCKRSLAL